MKIFCIVHINIIVPILYLLRHKIVCNEGWNLSFKITLSECASFYSPVYHSLIYTAIKKSLSSSCLVRQTLFSYLIIFFNEALIHVEFTIMEKRNSFIKKVSALISEHGLHLYMTHISAFWTIRKRDLVDMLQNLVMLYLVRWVIHTLYKIFELVFGFEYCITPNERLRYTKLASSLLYINLNVLIVHNLLPVTSSLRICSVVCWLCLL